MPEGADSSPLFGSIQNTAKTLAGFSVLVAAFGLLAIRTQFESWGIPSTLLGVDQEVRAGLLPMAAFIVVYIFVTLAFRLPWLATAGFQTIVLVPILIAMIVIFALVFSGLLADGVWIVSWIINELNISGLDEQSAFNIAQWVIAALVLIVLVAIRVESAKSPKTPNDVRTSQTNSADAAVFRPSNPISGLVAKLLASGLGQIAVWSAVFLGAVLIWALIARATLSGLWWYGEQIGLMKQHSDAALSARYINTYSLVIGVLAVGLLLPMLAVQSMQNSRLSRWYAAVSAAFVFVAALYAYCVVVYPMIPQAFGGGRPDRLDLWIAAEDFPIDAQSRLIGACTRKEKLVSCQRVSAIMIGDSHWALLSSKPPALVLMRDSVKMLSTSGP